MNNLTRSYSDRMFFGVCGGLGEYLGIDSRIIRILAVFGTLASFSAIFWIYLLLAIALPNEK
jgi:phage shock protein PspC (stress-responsive transcriptional regulator)